MAVVPNGRTLFSPETHRRRFFSFFILHPHPFIVLLKTIGLNVPRIKFYFIASALGCATTFLHRGSTDDIATWKRVFFLKRYPRTQRMRSHRVLCNGVIDRFLHLQIITYIMKYISL